MHSPLSIPVDEARGDAAHVCAGADEEDEDEQERVEVEERGLGACVSWELGRGVLTMMGSGLCCFRLSVELARESEWVLLEEMRWKLKNVVDIDPLTRHCGHPT